MILKFVWIGSPFLMSTQVATLTALMLFAMPGGWRTFGKMEGVLVQLQRVPIEHR